MTRVSIQSFFFFGCKENLKQNVFLLRLCSESYIIGKELKYLLYRIDS